MLKKSGKQQKSSQAMFPCICHDCCAYHFAGLEISAISGKAVVPQPADVQKVDSLPLIVRQPQWVQFADRYYRVHQEGLYRFWDWGQVKAENPWDMPRVLQNKHRYGCVIYFKKDILRLLGALAMIHVHGVGHQPMMYRRALKAAKQGTLSLTCGCISDFVCRLLGDLGWKTRRVAAMRVEGPYNTYDNGHQLFEFYWPKYKKWVLADVDMHAMFKKNGQYLNLGEVSELIQAGKDFDLEPLTPNGFGAVDTSDAVAGKFNFAAFCEPIALDPILKKEWFRRTLEIPLIGSDGASWFFCNDEKKAARVLGYAPGYKVLDKTQWFTRFYQ